MRSPWGVWRLRNSYVGGGGKQGVGGGENSISLHWGRQAEASMGRQENNWQQKPCYSGVWRVQLGQEKGGEKRDGKVNMYWTSHPWIFTTGPLPLLISRTGEVSLWRLLLECLNEKYTPNQLFVGGGQIGMITISLCPLRLSSLALIHFQVPQLESGL